MIGYDRIKMKVYVYLLALIYSEILKSAKQMFKNTKTIILNWDIIYAVRAF